MSPAKTAEPIEMPSEDADSGEPKEPCIIWGFKSPKRKGQFLRVIRPIKKRYPDKRLPDKTPRTKVHPQQGPRTKDHKSDIYIYLYFHRKGSNYSKKRKITDKARHKTYLCVVSYVVSKNGATTFAQLNRVAPFLLAHSLNWIEFCATFGGFRN